MSALRDLLTMWGIGWYRYARHAADSYTRVTGPYPTRGMANQFYPGRSGIGLLNIWEEFHFRRPKDSEPPDPWEVEKFK